MAKRFVNELVEKETVDEVFLVNEKQLRANRAGSLYLQLRLADRTGSFTAMMWNANERIADGFSGGDYVRVQGTTQFYNGQLQMILTRVQPVAREHLDPADFVVLGSDAIDRLVESLASRLDGLRNVHLRRVASAFMSDEAWVRKLRQAPAGIKNHHAYRGGLIEHIVSVVDLADRMADKYSRLDRDLLVMGAFLHDLGKLEELTYERELGYSESGQLLGHVVLGVRMLDERLAEVAAKHEEPVPERIADLLRHLILSHHGEYEFGSPKLPMFPEAVALHLIDNLDAKLHHYFQLIDEDPSVDGPWTAYQPALGRKIYKGTLDS